MGLKVLSICGGLETGLLALKELGIPVDEYHTYEIYAPAIELSKRHFPEVPASWRCNRCRLLAVQRF